MRIGIFGGAFNPVHEMHVKIALAAIEQLDLDKLFVVPSFISPHKNVALAEEEHRMNMLSLAFKDEKKVEISDYETEKGGKSYSFITAEHFKSLYPDAEIFMLVGADMLNDFFTWKNPERILSSVTLAAVERDGYFCDYGALEKDFINRYGKTFCRVRYKGKDVSSTEIRTYWAFGFTPKGVPSSVSEYIKENSVYKPDKYVAYVKSVLPEKRLLHTANVVICAEKKAKELALDEEKVRIAATLHDCAKYDDPEKYADFTLEKDVPFPVVHAFLGAFVAENVLGVKDPEILDAIRYHTSGKAEMSLLSKLIFVADMLEKGRDYEGVDRLRSLYEKDFDVCFRECLTEEIKHLINKGTYIYKETLNAYDYYVKQGKI